MTNPYRWIYRGERPGSFGRTLLSYGTMPVNGETPQEVAARVASMIRTGHAYTGDLVVTVWVGDERSHLNATPPVDARTFRYRDAGAYLPGRDGDAPAGNSMVLELRIEGRTILQTTIEKAVLKSRINGGDGEIIRVVYRQTDWEEGDPKPPVVLAARLVIEELAFPPSAGEGDPLESSGLPGGGK